jgi:serine/threonine-protein kinase
MGEVYRADDIKLDEAVALKFLPARLQRDPILLARLHEEVRLGRQISHPNVCRTYDIVEAAGAHFVSMEYVDGEDLSRLQRRIGRLAHDKAVDIARGIAAGLVAAHAKGILHRDLKPANIMIDSRGDARIMDFGLALAAGEDDGSISGTPAYMAPEQVEGAPATVQSDLYALGLVMYELFTGRRAHGARTLPERRRDVSSQIRTPSEVIRDLDPAVERVILRCLSNDPAQRPRSAHEIIEALPGSDPLAAALAAGETPSPRIVAAAGTEGSLSRRAAWSLLSTIAVLFALIAYVRGERSLGRYAPPMSPPDVLHDRATAVLRTHGVPARGAPVAGIYDSGSYYAWLVKGHRWDTLRNGPDWVSYRLEYGVTRMESERMPRMAIAPGRTSIEIDARGRLVLLLVSPEGEVKPRPLDWNALLEAAGLDAGKLQPIQARFTPPVPLDTARAWTGTYPNDDTPIRVEAAAWRGMPTYFHVTGAWDDVVDPMKGIAFSAATAGPFLAWVAAFVILSAVLLAWRNVQLRRGDRQGAVRLAAVVFLSVVAALLLIRMRLQDVGDAAMIVIDSIGEALFVAGAMYLFYIAVEPFIRRRWPTLLIGWARLASGQVGNPMVGRDVLIGIAAGLTHVLIASGDGMIVGRVTGRDEGPYLGDTGVLLGLRASLADVFGAISGGIRDGLIVIVCLVIFMIVLRRKSLAAGALYALAVTAFTFATAGQWTAIPFNAFLAGVMTLVAVRYGLLAFAFLQGTFGAIFSIPSVSASWAAPMMVIPYAAVALLALWAFHTSLGGQPMFSASLLDE